jgi:glycine/D-amino acid oxidase-like deaminating enzyme
MLERDFDVIQAGEQTWDVVGGGAASLSAALTLARVRRSVLVIDAGEPLTSPAPGYCSALPWRSLRAAS